MSAPLESVAQKTLRTSIECCGIGLHSGLPVNLVLRPGAINQGIVFKRVDLAGADALIPARWDHVVDTRLCTVIGNAAGATVGTIEHLMAALRGAGIDNATIEVDRAEVPIMDGSAQPFSFLIECAGTLSQAASRSMIRILQPVEIRDGDASARLEPDCGFSFEMAIDFPEPIGAQSGGIRLGHDNFRTDLARARTFGFLAWVEELRRLGLAKGGSLDNAIVVSGDGVVNAGGLRYTDEFVRHKLLDAIGDLYLAEAPILGRFIGHKSGHALNNMLLRALFENDDAWCYDTVGSQEDHMTRYRGMVSASQAITQVAV